MEIEYQKSNIIKLADIIGDSQISTKVKNHNKISFLFNNQLAKLKKHFSPNLENNSSKENKFKAKNKQIKELHNNHTIFRKINNTAKMSSKINHKNKTRNKTNNQNCSNKTSIINEKDCISTSNINNLNDPLFVLNNNLITNVNNNFLTINLQNHTSKNSKKYLDKHKNFSLINNTNKNNYINKYVSNCSSNLDDDQFFSKNNKTINSSNNMLCLNVTKKKKDTENYFTSISSNKSYRIRRLIKNNNTNQSNSTKNYKFKDSKHKMNDITRKNNNTIIFSSILKKKLEKNIVFRKKNNQRLSERFFTSNNSINPLINYTNFSKNKESTKDNPRYSNNLVKNSSYFIKKQNKSGNKIISINKNKKFSLVDKNNITNISLRNLNEKKINYQKKSLIIYLQNSRSISKIECKRKKIINNQIKFEKEKKNYNRVINVPLNLLKKRNSSFKRKSEERKKFYDSKIIFKKNNNSTDKICKKIRKIKQINNDLISSNSKSNYLTKNFINVNSIIKMERNPTFKLFQLKKSPISKTHINYKYLKKIKSVDKSLLKKSQSKSPTLRKYKLNFKISEINGLNKRCKTEKMTYITGKSKNKMKKDSKIKNLNKNKIKIISLSYTEKKSTKFFDKNPQNVSEYIDEILYILLIEEKKLFEKKYIDPFYLISEENEITPEMRAMVVDWIIEVHHVFNFHEKSLFVSVQLMDRYLSKTKIKINEFQLVAITCINIATKHDEVIFPIIANYVSVCGNKITAEDMMKTEIKILTEIKYEILKPNIYDFFEIFAYIIKMNQIEIDQGLYLLNTLLIDVNMLQYHSSILAFCVIKIITKKNTDGIINFLNEIYGKVKRKIGSKAEFFKDIIKKFQNEKSLDEIIQSIKVLFRTVLKTHYINTRNKFESQKFHAVSTFSVI